MRNDPGGEPAVGGANADGMRAPGSWRRSLLRYLPFACFSAAQSGIAGLIIPRLAGNPADAGFAWATFYLGTGIGSVIWGQLTTRLGRAMVLRAGLALSIVGMLGLAVVRGAGFPLVTMLLGVAGAAVQLTAVLFIRLWYPRPEWDEQLGSVETWMGVGQVSGIVLAAVVASARTSAEFGSLLVGIALLTALPLRAPRDRRPHPVIDRAHVSVQRGEHNGLTPAFHLAALRLPDINIMFTRSLLPILGRWGLLMLASIPVGALAPLLFRDTFMLDARTVSAGLAVVSALSVSWYRPASRISHRYGAMRVLTGGTLVRAAGIFALAMATWQHGPAWIAFASYALFVIAWPPLSIASTLLVDDAAPPDQAGAALGLYNAVASAARVVGSALAGVLASRFGFAGLLFICGLIIVLTMLIPPVRTASAAATHDDVVPVSGSRPPSSLRPRDT